MFWLMTTFNPLHNSGCFVPLPIYPLPISLTSGYPPPPPLPELRRSRHGLPSRSAGDGSGRDRGAAGRPDGELEPARAAAGGADVGGPATKAESRSKVGAGGSYDGTRAAPATAR